jgi:bifunctional NMN adenylyltransferase/nudix hydrolase
MKLNDYDIGVIVGRFQIATLHSAHKAIIAEVVKRHKKCIIFIGISPTLGTKEHPLDFTNRKAMIESEFPTAIVLPLLDVNDDVAWSNQLDNLITTTFHVGSVCLYGGRDSFLPYYKGKFDIYEFPTVDYRPAKEVRAEIGKEIVNAEDFRKGIIYSTHNQYKRTHLTVDVMVYSISRYEVLLGRKLHEREYRFIGGFVEGETLEQAVQKEVKEEANISLCNIQYLGSHLVNDWRYSNTSDKVLTSFFSGEIDSPLPEVGDDLVEVKWVPMWQFLCDYDNILIKSHAILFKEHGYNFIDKLVKRQKLEKKRIQKKSKK